MCKFRESTNERRPYHSIMHTVRCANRNTRAYTIIILVVPSGSGSFMTLHFIGGGIAGTNDSENKGAENYTENIYPNVRCELQTVQEDILMCLCG